LQPSDEYREAFEKVFTNDLAFSRKFSDIIDKILLKNLAQIRNHEKRKTNEDIKADNLGYDRTIYVPKIPIGVRMRREFYWNYFDFTVDTKEWNRSTYPNFYFYGYGNEDSLKIKFYILFNYKEFKCLVEKKLIEGKLCKNTEHSLVLFWAFSLTDILKKCKVIDYEGDIPSLEDFV